jgi:uncharacterized protein (TIGR02270 family)
MPYLVSPKTELILWDVVEEHFEESAFLFGQWENALYSPRFDLAGLGKIEKRLEAHVDGLIVSGAEGARRILDPELSNGDDPDHAVVSALALLFSGGDEIADRVLETALHAQTPLDGALAHALVLASLESIDRNLLNRIRSVHLESEKALLLEILTGRGIDVGELLCEWSDSSDPRLIGAVLNATARFARRDLVAFAEEHLRSPKPVRAKALRATISLGSRTGWQLCRALSEQPDTAGSEALSYLGLLGDSSDHEVLYAQVDNPAQVERAMWALAFAGTLRAGDVCLTQLESDDERVAKAAAEAMSWIGGFDLDDRRFRADPREPTEEEALPPLDEDDLDANLVPDGLDDLPVPNRAAIAQWWKENRNRLTPQGPNILGRAGSETAVVHALEAGSMWRRHGLAFKLEIRSEGRLHVSTDAFSARQRRQMAALSGQTLRMEP